PGERRPAAERHRRRPGTTAQQGAMNDLVMLEASLFQLRTAIASIEDETTLPQLELTVSVLANGVAAAREALNAARVSDIEFALNDVAGGADSLPANDAAAIR